MVICLERGADLHMAQLMPLPLTVSCYSKIQIGFTFLVLAHLGSPGKGPLNGCVCVYGRGTAAHRPKLTVVACSKFFVRLWMPVRQLLLLPLLHCCISQKNTCLLAIVRSFCNDSIQMMHGCECDIQIC